MRLKVLVTAVAVAAFSGTGIASANHVAQVDPTSVPGGFLVAHNVVADVPLSSLARAALADGADVFIQHVQLGPNVATGWHTHPGPAIVTVVAGSVAYQDAKGGECRSRGYVADQGFVDPGFGHVHRAIAGPSGVHFYAIYILPHGSMTHVIPAAVPTECAS